MQMKNRLVSRCLPVVCLLVTSLYTNLVLADWSVNQPRGGYNQGYGDFPPADINKQIFGYLDTGKQVEESQPQDDSAPVISGNNQTYMPPAQNYPVQNYPAQNYQQPSYGNYGRRGPYNQAGIPGNYPVTNFSGPWNNNGSNFTGPWNGNGSNFSGPWNNNGSNFSAPWGNNRSGSSPFGNGNGWSW